MFFYLSFLRTPPQSSLQSSSVVFTPQVTNDLRTEPFPTSIDIFYWWISYPPQKVTRLSEPAKLTTWRQENAYRPLQIPPPPAKNPIGAAAAIDCSLVLSPAPIVTSSVINLRDPEIGRVPLPVCSLPIRISASPQGPQQQRRDGVATTKSPKQEAITRTFRLFDDGDATRLMQIKETVSFDLDKKLWDSGIGLSAWLVRLSESVVDHDTSAVESSMDLDWIRPAVVRELKERLFGCSSNQIIELGAGTGVVSLVLAALRSASLAASHAESCILSTDLPSSMELMSYNIRTNAALYPNCPPTALPLDWDEELPETVRNICEHGGGFDLVVMADVTYNTSSFPTLLQTVASLLAQRAAARRPHHGTADDAVPDDDDDVSGSQEQEQEQDGRGREHDPLVLLAYKERDPAERQLWDMMTRETGVVLECVGKQAGAGGLPVEIWLGKRRR